MIRTVTLMGTLVTMQLDQESSHAVDAEECLDRAFEWFRRVEACCTRFDPKSELMQATSQVGVAVPASVILYETVRFALALAEETGGAFDPTVGGAMETRGFNRDYRTGQAIHTALSSNGGTASHRDVQLDPSRRTITLLRPLVLDLGAVAKGFAIDMAARELRAFENFAIDAGGDLYFAGAAPDGSPWRVGIAHPRDAGELIDVLTVSNQAVCTSGDYERLSVETGHHILDPRTAATANAVASVTVVAPTAMVADALATAAFILGPTDGLRLLERQDVNGLMVLPTLERVSTAGMRSLSSRAGLHASS